MYKILHSKTNRLELPNYITQEDLQQELYFALCNAVQAYDDTKPYVFNSYLNFQIMRVIRNALHNSDKIKEYSYNQTSKEDEETELIDLMSDSTSEDYITDIELTDIQTMVREAVAELPSREKSVISLNYFDGQNLTQIAENLSVSTETVRSIKNKGLRILRQNKAIRGLYQETEAHYSHSEKWDSLAAVQWDFSKEYYYTLRAIEKRRQNGEYISYGAEQSIMTIAKQQFIKSRTSEYKEIATACKAY